MPGHIRERWLLKQCIFAYISFIIYAVSDEGASLSYLIVINISYCVTGLQHEGIFRVSGSQVEVNDIKNAFERGKEDLFQYLRNDCQIYVFV